jgi:hypothetical protein
MQRARQPQEPTQRGSRLVFAGAVLAVLALLVILTVTTRLIWPSDSSASTANTLTDDSTQSKAPATTVGARDEIVSRLHQILRIRDRAIQTRDSQILDEIYTIDCPCLRGDRALIERLKKEKLVWHGIEVSLAIEEVEQVNDRLWIVNALVKTSAFEIRRESGATVREVPSGQERSRFALARPEGQNAWLLGQASVLAERD